VQNSEQIISRTIFNLHGKSGFIKQKGETTLAVRIKYPIVVIYLLPQQWLAQKSS